MKDYELQQRLMALGMAPSKAEQMTREIRDYYAPVASVTALKLQEHGEGMAGLAGYEYDQLSGLFKKVKKAVKKVAKGAVKVVGTAAGIVAPVLPVAAVVAGAAALVKDKKKPAAPPVVAVEAPIADAADKTASQLVKYQHDAPMASTQEVPGVQQLPSAAVPAVSAVQQGASPDVAEVLSYMLAQNAGANMQSPPAQQLVREVAAQGVEQTAAGPSPLPPWLLPAGIGAVVLVGVLAMRGGRR